MTESDRLCNLIYSLIFSEETRLQDEVDNAFYILRQSPHNIHYIERYRQCVQRCDDFKILSDKVIEVLKRF